MHPRIRSSSMRSLIKRKGHVDHESTSKQKFDCRWARKDFEAIQIDLDRFRKLESCFTYSVTCQTLHIYTSYYQSWIADLKY